MQIVQIDMVRPQHLQTPVQVAFKTLVVPRVTFAGQENAIPISCKDRSDHSFAGIETYRTLIARDSDWANSAYVQKLDDYTDLEKHLLLTVLHKTLELHPELSPRKSNAPQ